MKKIDKLIGESRAAQVLGILILIGVICFSIFWKLVK